MDNYLTEFIIETVELPGRGMRSDEALLTDFELAAQDLYIQIKSKLNQSQLVLFGHSMGALLALKIAKMFEQNEITPVCIFVSGNPGPMIKENEKRYQLNDKDFMDAVRKLGGLPQEVLDSAELRDYFLPILKADFQISEENTLDEKAIINAPIYALMGDSEKFSNEIINWSKFTTSNFDYEVLNGDHFFINNHGERIAKKINEFYYQNKR